MRMKKLLVQLEYDPEKTRFLYTPDDLARSASIVLKSVVMFHTRGPVPAITVTEEEQPQAIPNYDANHAHA